MRKIIFLLIFISTPAFADWSSADTKREVTYQVLNIIDWGQTRYIAKNPNDFHERNSAWLIGKHPSTGDVNRLMIVSAVLHPVISYYLPHGWREAFQYVTIGDKLGATVNNASLGIKIEF